MAWKNKYVKWGLTAFCTVGALLLFSDTLFGSHALIRFGAKFLRASQPIIYGAAMAYLLAPMVNFFDRYMKNFLRKSKRTVRKVPLAIRSISILITWSITGFVLYLFGKVLAPELYKSILQLAANIETYYTTISHWVESLLERNPALEGWVLAQMDTYYSVLEEWFTRDLLPQATELMTVISGGVMVFVWKYVIAKLGGVFAIYELLPAFIIACIVIVVVSLLTPAPEQEIQDEFDEVAAMK